MIWKLIKVAVIATVAISLAGPVAGAARSVRDYASNAVASVKLESHAQLKASRSGEWVTFTATATRKTPWNSWVAWKASSVKIQRFSNGVWKTIKTAKADKNGKIYFKIKDGKPKIYRSYVDGAGLTLCDDSPRLKT